MRILHVAQAISHNFGGVQAVLAELTKAQVDGGLDVQVLSTNVDAPSGVLDVPANQLFCRDGVQTVCSSVQFRPLLVSRNLKRTVDAQLRKFDIVHIHGLYRFPSTYAAYRARKQGVPYVIQPHGSLDPFLYRKSSRSVLLKRLYEDLFDLPNLHAAGAIYYTTEDERERASYLKLRSPSIVVPNGIAWGRFRDLPLRGALRANWQIGDAPIVLFVGRVHPVKGLDLLIPAFETVHMTFPEARLVVVGPENDDYGRKARGWVRNRRLDGVVHFVGPLHGADLIQAYVDADVFALPSYTENFGMSVVEAMACGKPVVISDQVNIHREVEESGAGVVTRCDAGALAGALCDLLGDELKRRAIGDIGRRVASARYSWAPIVREITCQYEIAISNLRRN